MRYARLGMGLLLCSLLSGCVIEGADVTAATPDARVHVSVRSYPDLVLVPGYPVYYAPALDANYFFYDGYYWVYADDGWYTSYWYNGPWDYVEPDYVPVFILRIPVFYYRRPPVYFRGWRSNEPPRWGDRWGNDWEGRHRDWNRWDSRSAPAPAPRPDYQRHYSGSRYPRPEQQRMLQRQYYHYQPRDSVERGRGPNPRTDQQEPRGPQRRDPRDNPWQDQRQEQREQWQQQRQDQREQWQQQRQDQRDQWRQQREDQRDDPRDQWREQRDDQREQRNDAREQWRGQRQDPREQGQDQRQDPRQQRDEARDKWERWQERGQDRRQNPGVGDDGSARMGPPSRVERTFPPSPERAAGNVEPQAPQWQRDNTPAAREVPQSRVPQNRMPEARTAVQPAPQPAQQPDRARGPAARGKAKDGGQQQSSDQDDGGQGRDRSR